MIYVMSDIHGHYTRYKSIMQQIALQNDDRLYVLGDCIDRFPEGLDILKELFNMPNVTVLLGNHEHMMLQALTIKDRGRTYMDRWRANGGDVTYNHLKRCTKAYREEIIEIIRKLPVNIELRCNDADYLLVHGSPLGYKNKFGDPVFDSVWNRLDWFSDLPDGRTVIFGHTPTIHYQSRYPMGIFYGKNMIGIDCGSGYTDGRLGCLRLNDMEEFYSEIDWNLNDADEEWCDDV